MDAFQKLLDFLRRLEAHKIHYSLEHNRDQKSSRKEIISDIHASPIVLLVQMGGYPPVLICYRRDSGEQAD